MSKTPIAVLLSDVHYSIQTLEVADKATRMAIAHANDLEVPLVVCGDLHDTKANLRGECVSAMIKTFTTANQPPYVLVGNHDRINEKSTAHSLDFLRPLTRLIDEPIRRNINDGQHPIVFIPYQHDKETVLTELSRFSSLSEESFVVIMHQGIMGSDAGHYIQDKSALSKEDLAGFRVISGHYHRRQTLTLPEGGTFDYVGNPYTLGFGEANDPEKGFQVLYNDGSLEFVPTNLRKHVILECAFQDDGTFVQAPTSHIKPDDIIWVKCTGPTDVLCEHNKGTLSKLLNVWSDFRLDLIPTDTSTKRSAETKDLSQAELLDTLIESIDSTNERKDKLKDLWKLLLL